MILLSSIKNRRFYILNNLSKKFSTVLLSSAVMVTLLPTSSMATENDTESITSVKEIKKEIKTINESKLSKKEAHESMNEVVNRTPNDVVTDYQKKMSQEVVEAHNKIAEKMMDTTLYYDDNSKVYTRKETVVLSDGTKLTVEDEDSPILEENEVPTKNTVMKAAISRTDKFGSRSYKHTSKISLAVWADPALSLTTFYNASKSGLKATSTSTAGSFVSFPYSLTRSASITDNSAKKVGYDINTQGEYTLESLGLNGVGIFSTDFTVRSTVKLLKINSSSVKVSLSSKLY